MLIRNSSDEKYGSLKQELRGRYGGKFDEYPRTPEAAYDRLMEHKWDNTKDKKQKAKEREQNKTGTEDQHLNMNQKGSSNRVCWVCGSSEHIKTDCDILKKDTKYPYDKWFINQAVNTQRKYNQYQEKQREDEKSHIDDDAMSAISAMSGNDKDVWGGSKKATKTGSSNLQLGVSMNNTKKENNDLKNKWWNDFILDSGTTFSMLANRRLADKVFEAREPIIMHTNVGHKTLNEEAEVPGFGDMYLNEEGLANIFGLDDLVKRGYRVKFDSDIENAFQVYGPDNKLKGKFDRTVEGYML